MDRYPYDLGEGWPENFFPLIETRTKELQAEYDHLLGEIEVAKDVTWPGMSIATGALPFLRIRGSFACFISSTRRTRSGMLLISMDVWLLLIVLGL